MQLSLIPKTRFKTNQCEHPLKLPIEKTKAGEHLTTTSVKMLDL